MREVIARLQAKLIQLRLRDPGYQIFGSASHQYQLNPCITEQRLCDIESAYQIGLPPDYRTFLHVLGNGGAGPDYGVFPIEQSLEKSLDDARLLAAPFPHTSAWNLDPEAVGANFATGERIGEYDALYCRDEFVQGALRIHTEGCGRFTLLVVSGSESGHLWLDSRTDDHGIYPLVSAADPEARLTFIEWYEAWLDRSLRALTRSEQGR